MNTDHITPTAAIQKATGTAKTSAPNADAIIAECDAIKAMLLNKNESYGDSALNPTRTFAKKSDATEQLNVRIDDKLSRIQRGSEFPGDNDIEDLIGYLILLRIAQKQSNGSSAGDKL